MSEEKKFDQSKYANQYNRENYDSIKVMLPKGKKALLQDFAKEHNMSMNQLILHLIEVGCKIDMSK